MVLLVMVDVDVDVDVLFWGCFVAFRTLESEDFIVVVLFVDLLSFWVVGAMGDVAIVVCARL